MRVAVFAHNLSLFETLENPKISLKNKHKGNIWLASLDGVTDKNAADAMRGTLLYCDRSDLPALTEDEIYYADIVGMECIDENGQSIGIVKNVDNFGAGDLLDIHPANGSPAFYLSYTKETVLSVVDRRMTVRIPETI